MAAQSGELVQGTLEMLILKTLALEPMHGYGAALRIELMSHGVFRVNAGSLFSAFNRLERAGRLESQWKVTETHRRGKYYLLTERGAKRSTKRPASGSARLQPSPEFLRLDHEPPAQLLPGSNRPAP